MYVASEMPRDTQFSNEVYTIVYPNGNNIKLSNGNTYKRYSIFKVVSDAQLVINPKRQAIKNARYTHKGEKRLDKQEANIPTYEPRTIRSNFVKPPDKLTQRGWSTRIQTNY